MVIQKRQVFIIGLLVLGMWEVSCAAGSGVPGQNAEVFIGQDLYLEGKGLLSYQVSTGEHVLVFEDGFSMSIGANRLCGDKGVVWLDSIRTDFRGRVRIDYSSRVYIEGKISVEKAKGAKTINLNEIVIEQGQSMIVRFEVRGEVFVTAEKREVSDPRGTELYKRASAAAVPAGAKFVVQPGAQVPGYVEEKAEPAKPAGEKVEPKAVKPAEVAVEGEVKFRYPVNFAPAGAVKLQIESTKAPDGTDIATLTGRVYVWQKSDEIGGLLELQADNAVIFYSGKKTEPEKEQKAGADIAAGGAIKAIYMSGDVVMTEGSRTIRADEGYYDFERKKAIAINAEMRNFDVKRGIPIYVKAATLRQLCESKFSAENMTLTSSEFYQPQISLTASSVIITDTTAIDEQTGKASDSSYDAQMRDVRLKAYDKTIFHWPFMRSNLQRPDVPFKSVHVGNDNTWGTSLETRWYLSRLLGLKEPEGTDSTFELDYYGKRGVGSGVDIDYKRENSFGEVKGYLIDDSGKDMLGRDITRRNLDPENDLRGRFSWRHRQFLPYNWQVTTGVAYASDKNFMESYYRGEYDAGLPQETYIHLKRIEDNWGLSLLGKGRINDYADELEELPSGEFHLTGESLFEDRFTLYSDTEAGRLRQRIGDGHTTAIDEQAYTFGWHRTELDMPVRADPFKIVPFVAGNIGYDDRSGFTRTLVDGSNTGSYDEDKVFIGEAGVRASSQYWKVYPNVKSRLWDLNQLRHIVRPQVTGAFYGESDSSVEQRDILNVGISQRLQTKRKQAGVLQTVDWMRLDTDVTWVEDSSHDAGKSGPDRFMWNRPVVPPRMLSAPDIFNGDLGSGLRRFEMFGPRRNYFGADYVWRPSDTSAILSDLNFDMQSGVVQQFDVGLARLRWPNLSYYIGSRYLRRVEVLDEKGSNPVIFAATYVLDPRYTVVFGQQYDFDYGANIRSDITLIRQYHRMYCAFTYSVDESLGSQAIVFSIWPQGVPEMTMGPRRYTGLEGSAGYSR